MNWEVRVPKRVKKVIKQFPYKDRARIIQALREFVIDPWAGDIAKISDREDVWRKRIGNYRIFYSIQIRSRIVEIKEIARRTSKTY
ncbi:MAG: type II toxin-antitoxin system RelE/ParE family toxin [Candidatus Sungiibacteriota bacterium]